MCRHWTTSNLNRPPCVITQPSCMQVLDRLQPKQDAHGASNEGLTELTACPDGAHLPTSFTNMPSLTSPEVRAWKQFPKFW